MHRAPPNGPAPYRIHLDTPPDGPANAFAPWWARHGVDVCAYVLKSRWYLKELSEDLRAMYNEFLSGNHRQRGIHPIIYVARLTHFLRKMEIFQYIYRKMDGILAVSLEMQERDMRELETEIELWRCASTSRTLISDLFKRLDAVVKSNPAYPDDPPELIWTVVMSGITDIEGFLHETADIEEFLRDRARMQ